MTNYIIDKLINGGRTKMKIAAKKIIKKIHTKMNTMMMMTMMIIC